MIGPIVLGTGQMPDVCALPTGWLFAWRDAGGLQLVRTDRAGVVQASYTIPTGSDQDSTFPRLTVFDGIPWLAYRAFRGGIWVACLRTVIDAPGVEHILGETLGNDPVCLSADGWGAWQEQTGPGTYDVHGIRLDSGASQVLASKAVGTGIARCDGGVIVFVDDNHGSVPGMLDPVMAGACTVGKAQNGGIAVLMQDGTAGVLLPGQDTGDPRVADGGAGAYAAVCWGPLGVRFVTFTEADVVPAPFAFAPFDHPVLIAPFAAAGSGAIDLFDVGLYTEVTDPSAVIATAAATGMRLLLGQDGPHPPPLPAGLRPWDIPFRELYRLKSETLAQSVARWIADTESMLEQWPGDCGVIPMFYKQAAPDGSPLWTDAEVLEGLAYLSQIVNLSPRITVVAPFELNRADEGITSSPVLMAAFRSLQKATPGTPTFIPIGSTPVPSPVPQPKPKPTPAPAPVSDFLTLEGVTMSLPQNVAIVGPGGKFASVEPHTKVLTFDKPTAGGWETFELSKPDDRYMLRSLATDTGVNPADASDLIFSVDVTQFGSNDIRKLFALVSQSKRGNYESFNVEKTSSGLFIAFIEYINQGVITKPFASPILTVVPL